MKKQKTQSKIIVALTAVVILLVAVSATLTFAYFTANTSDTSDTMTFGALTMSSATLTVSDADTSTHIVTTNGNMTGLVPGCTIGLNGTTVPVANNIDAFVRFRIGFKVDGGDAADQLAKAKVVRNALAGVPAKWIKGAEVADNLAALDTNGYLWTGYYYTKTTSNGNSAADILAFTAATKFQFSTELDNTWQGKIVTLTIEAQAIQAEHLTKADGDDADNDPDAVANGTVSADGLGNGEVAVADLEAVTAWTVAGTQANANAA